MAITPAISNPPPLVASSGLVASQDPLDRHSALTGMS